MAYGRNLFIDPRTGAQYAWQVNHDTEESVGRQRPVTSITTTNGTGRIVQQGDEAPLKLKLSGTILHAAQFAQMRAFYDLSRTQTIIFQDFAGDRYEVVIDDFEPLRKRTARNPRDSSIGLHYWTYTIEMTVVRVISGAWAGTSP